MKNKLFNLALVATLAVSLFGCRKDSFEGDETKESGTTYAKIQEGTEVKLFFSPFSDVKNIHLISVRRDVSSSAELNTTATIKTELNGGVVAKYNTTNSETFEVLPASYYTLAPEAGVTKTAAGFDFTFSPGDFAKNLNINVDGSKWVDLGKKYAVGLRVTDWGGLKKTAGLKDSIVILLSIKNKYDGVYEVKGTMVDATNATLTHFTNFVNSAANIYVDPPYEMELRTISPTKCAAYDNYFFGGYYALITSGSSYSQYGSFSPIFEFDPATDKVIGVTNYYGQPAANTRAGRLDPSGINKYDSATKTMSVTYNMTQTSVVTTPPHVRTTWTETWSYLRARK